MQAVESHCSAWGRLQGVGTDLSRANGKEWNERTWLVGEAQNAGVRISGQMALVSWSGTNGSYTELGFLCGVLLHRKEEELPRRISMWPWQVFVE